MVAIITIQSKGFRYPDVHI
ncbi:hypothetical protein ID866_7327 [Astraeus odoratus]|nr:hypothetical protein ID866_7327 [Astraeus odoratus]